MAAAVIADAMASVARPADEALALVATALAVAVQAGGAALQDAAWGGACGACACACADARLLSGSGGVCRCRRTCLLALLLRRCSQRRCTPGLRAQHATHVHWLSRSTGAPGASCCSVPSISRHTCWNSASACRTTTDRARKPRNTRCATQVSRRLCRPAARRPLAGRSSSAPGWPQRCRSAACKCRQAVTLPALAALRQFEPCHAHLNFSALLRHRFAAASPVPDWPTTDWPRAARCRRSAPRSQVIAASSVCS